MAIDLMRVNRMPAPLDPPKTGDAKLDAAIAKLQAWEHSPANPFPTPGGHDYVATVKLARKAKPAALLSLLTDAACDAGHLHWDDGALGKLGTKDKKAFREHYDRCALASKSRSAYLTWLMDALLGSKEGLERVIEIAASPKVNPSARVAAAGVLAQHEDPKAQEAIAKALDPRRWDGKDGVGQHRALWRVYATGAEAMGRIGPKVQYDRLAELLTPAAAKGAANKARAEAALSGLIASETIDARWNARLPALLSTDLQYQALMALENAPADPSLVPPLCAHLGKKPEKITYFNDTAVRLLGRCATKDAVPWLAAALRASWTHYPAVFEGFRNAGDPAAAPIIRAWLEGNGDGPKGERTKLGTAVIKELEAKAKKQGVAVPEYKPPPEKKEPPKKRPVLVYKPIKPTKLPKLESLATLEKLFTKAFADAKLEKYMAKIAQRAVWLIPTRVDEAKLAVGATKLGGHPDMDAKTEWPRVKGTPLTFLAQLDLAEMSKHLPKNAAPSKGLLLVFVGEDFEGPAGYLENARALLMPPKAKLARREVPDDYTGWIYQACSVAPMATIKLPSPTNRHVTSVLKNKADRDRYASDVCMDTPALPQFLGYRDHGWDAEEPATAQMLLQLTGDEPTDMQFGDCDYLSFFMDAKKLAAGDFSKVWPHIGD